MLVAYGYAEYVKYFQCITEEWIDRIPGREAVDRFYNICLTIAYVVVRCVINDLNLAWKKLNARLLDTTCNYEYIETFLHTLVQDPLPNQLVTIFLLVLLPMLTIASIYVFFCPRSKEDDEIVQQSALSSEMTSKENIGFPSSEKLAIVQTTSLKQSDEDDLAAAPTTPTRAPKLPSVAPRKYHSPWRHRLPESIGTPPAPALAPTLAPTSTQTTPATPRNSPTTPPREVFSLSPRSRERPEPLIQSVHSSPGDEERSIDCTEYTDLEVDSKLSDDQDLAYVLRRCVIDPRALVGWRIMLPTVHKGAVGVVLSTVKRPFNTTKFLIEMQDASVEQLALQRGTRKHGVPFNLLEKVQ